MAQRRVVLIGLASVPLLALTGLRPALAQVTGTPVAPDSLPTSAGAVVIQPVNHASLILGYGTDVFYFDPVGGGARYAPFARPSAIFITHAHADHFDVPTLEAVAGRQTVLIAPEVVIDKLPPDLRAKAQLLANGDHRTIEGVAVDAIPAYNTTPDRLKYHPKGVGNGYVLSFGDKKIYVAGDTEPTPAMLGLKEIDVAFLPMNLPYTMTGPEAAAAVKTFKPKIVYPYHYGKDGPEPARFAAALHGFAGVALRQRDWYQYG